MLNDSNRLAGLDVLRIVAVAGVMMAHYFWSKEWINDKFGADPEIVFGDIAHIAAYGFLGVHLFLS
jgi:peptidoglycan/LPS O-acetylase OafA/YrhL